MQISVVILNYNVRYFLEQCVLSVQKALQNLDGEIIVVDNNSPDDSCTMIKQRFPNVKLIENKENSGFPKGNNIGVAVAQGEYLCILNPDTVVAEDTFEKLLEFAKTKTNLGIVGCKLIDGTGNFLPESKRGIPTPFVAMAKISGLYKLFPKVPLFGKYYAQHLTENQTGKVDVLVGAFMLMKRSLYNELSGFDEAFFMYGEDIDLSYRSLKSGNENYYFAGTTVIHYKGESTVKDRKYLERFQTAMQLFYHKHFKVSFVFKVFMDFGAYVFSVVKMKKSDAKPRNIDAYCLFSNDVERAGEVENLLGKKVRLLDAATENNLNSPSGVAGKNVEIIFDNNSCSFRSIIELMQRHNNNQFTFKILPEKSRFLIGSNSSNDRGEVIRLS
ncbi:glycosyltransferase family 2 protein [Flavobacterium sp. CYK-4]|uniref:glycosyltransferase family 2 protein n=1 Tax=Flavobacterium lotistagni TaxID=2709660 RepID=UPI001407A3AE|nr:glycosyltransferase family 2 protein [Flavobacterium lotistagni]NHM06278.1 glycosyltransferase family 2 protein [Flavobacterium lotistagni]